jgi:hypothetical protein
MATGGFTGSHLAQGKQVRTPSRSYSSLDRRGEDGKFIFAILCALVVLVVFWMLYVAAFGPHLFLL